MFRNMTISIVKSAYYECIIRVSLTNFNEAISNISNTFNFASFIATYYRNNCLKRVIRNPYKRNLPFKNLIYYIKNGSA